jgi:hypothetical protein
MVFIKPYTIDNDVDNNDDELFDKLGQGGQISMALENLYCSLVPLSAARMSRGGTD